MKDVKTRHTELYRLADHDEGEILGVDRGLWEKVEKMRRGGRDLPISISLTPNMSISFIIVKVIANITSVRPVGKTYPWYNIPGHSILNGEAFPEWIGDMLPGWNMIKAGPIEHMSPYKP